MERIIYIAYGDCKVEKGRLVKVQRGPATVMRRTIQSHYFYYKNGKVDGLMILSQETCHMEEHLSPTGDGKVLRILMQIDLFDLYSISIF